MNPIDKVYAATLQRIQELNTELRTLEIKKTTLEEVGAGRTIASVPAAKPKAKAEKSSPKAKTRAPAGYLANHAIARVTTRGVLNARELYELLVSGGYGYSLTVKQLKKTLRALVQARKLAVAEKGGMNIYSLPGEKVKTLDPGKIMDSISPVAD